MKFFNWQDYIKTVKLKIKPEPVEASLDDTDLREVVMYRLMERLKVMFRK